MPFTPDQKQALHDLDQLGALSEDSQEFLRAAVTTAGAYFLPLHIECGITLHNQGQLVSVAQSHPILEVIEEMQNPDDGGPVFESIERGATTVVHEAANDPRWPQYLQMVAGHGFHSILSVCLAATGTTRATINFYAEPPHSFTPGLRMAGEHFAAATAQHLRAHLTRRRL